MQNTRNLSWACFEACNPNKEDAFESMCCAIFKKAFLMMILYFIPTQITLGLK